jgi:hypothetical protein
MSDPVADPAVVDPIVVVDPVVIADPAVADPVVVADPAVADPVVVADPAVADPVVVVADPSMVSLDVNPVSNAPVAEINTASILIPITNTVTFNVTSYQVEESVTVILNSKAIVYVLFFTDGNVTYRRRVELSGADYDAWTSDDNYIYTFVQTNAERIFHSEPTTA